MKTYRHYILVTFFIIILTFLPMGCSQQGPRQEENAPRDVVIAISPDLSEVVIPTVAWLTHQANCRVRVYDGSSANQLTEFAVPKAEYFKESAVARSIGAPLQKWIAWSREKPTNSKLSGSGAVCVPKLLDRLAQEHSMPEHLIILGSPVARFPTETNYDFAEPHLRYPGDGQIQADGSSPFSCQGKEHSLSGTRIYFLFPRVDTGSWPSSYESKLHHFFGRFFASRSGNLVAFTPDLDAGLKLVNSSAKLPFNLNPAVVEAWIFCKCII